MRYLGLSAFGVTVCVLTPLIRLSAGPVERAKLFAPAATELVVDGATVKIAIDHPFADPGEKVHLLLTTDKEVQVGLVVLGSSGNEGARVPDPPRPVAHETITLSPDKRKDVAIRLANARTSVWQPYGDYRFYVMSPSAAARLQQLVDRAGPSIPSASDIPIPDMDTDTQKLFSTLWGITGGDLHDRPARDQKLFAQGSVAMVEAYSRPLESEVAIAAPDQAKQNEPFTVRVTVQNPRDHAMQNVQVSLVVMKIGAAESYRGLAETDVKIDDESAPITLRPHEKKTVEMTVTAPHAGVLGLEAHATCADDHGCRDDDRLRRGTFEAVEIVGASPNPPA